MIEFLLKGLLRDRSRSLFPIAVISVGVALVVVLQAWMNGALGDMLGMTARYQTGHIKVTTRAYAELMDQGPNDLALLEVTPLQEKLEQDYPELFWTSRIRFGGLLDIPDENGETREQGPVAGLGIDLFGENSREPELLNLAECVVQGRMPEHAGEILVSDEFALRLNLKPGDDATLISSTMYGSMSTWNFKVSGTIRFGISAMDRGSFIADISDVRAALDMQDAAGEILGFYHDLQYRDQEAVAHVKAFNQAAAEGEFEAVMAALRDQNDMGTTLDMSRFIVGIMLMVFVFMMFIVLWNAGLMSGLRRYGEVGVRLAIGEPKSHIYRAMLIEALALGIIGSAIGTCLGMLGALYMQEIGLRVDATMQQSSLMVPNVMRARIEPFTWIVGFLPGVPATLMGTAVAGIGIYKRQTAQLFKELEV